MALPFLDPTSRQTSKLKAKCVDTHRNERGLPRNESWNQNPATLQRDRTVTKLQAIEDRATGTWHFRFRFLDQTKKVKTIIVPGDIASLARKLLPRLHKAGARLPLREKEATECHRCSYRARAHRRHPLRRPARMAGRQRWDPSVLIRKHTDRATGQGYVLRVPSRPHVEGRQVRLSKGRFRIGGAGSEWRQKSRPVRPYWSPPLLPHRSCRSRR